MTCSFLNNLLLCKGKVNSPYVAEMIRFPIFLKKEKGECSKELLVGARHLGQMGHLIEDNLVKKE